MTPSVKPRVPALSQRCHLAVKPRLRSDHINLRDLTLFGPRLFRQREDVAASATNPAVIGYRYYPPYTTVDFNLEYGITRWAKLFVSGRNITNARKVRYRVLEGAPDWSHFQIANSLGAQYTVGITGRF